MKFVTGQKFGNVAMGDRLEVTGVTRYRVYYRITLAMGGVEYSTGYHFDTFPATYIEGMLGKSEFGKALVANRFTEIELTDDDTTPRDPTPGGKSR